MTLNLNCQKILHVECHDDLSLYGQSLFIALTFLTNSVLAKFALRHAAVPRIFLFEITSAEEPI